MRSIRPQTITLAVVAILFGLVAAWAARQILFAKPERVVAAVPPPVVEPREKLLILQANLPENSRVLEANVAQTDETVAHMKERKVPLTAMKFKAQAVGRILKMAKPAGSWLSEDDFWPLGTGPEMKLEKGYRAVWLRVDDPAVSNNLIPAGCRVDVVLTAEHPDDSSKLTQRIASRMLVLSPPVSEGGVPNAVTLISGKSYIVLAARPKDANRLELAQQMGGTISVTLCTLPQPGEQTGRQPNAEIDDKANGEPGDRVSGQSEYRVDDQMGDQVGERDLLNLPRRVAPAPPERIVVEQIRGDKFDYVVFTEDDVRLTQEQARQNSIPPGANAAVPTSGKKCKTCGKGKRSGGESFPPIPAPVPTPAPGGSHDVPPIDPVPPPSRAT